MIGDLLARSPILVVPLGVLFLFLGVFLGAVFRAYATRRGAFDEVARLPLTDDDSSTVKPS